MMFMLGFVLLGSTLMLPLFTQTLLGYDATTAGMAISPGGVVIMFFMPVVGFLLQKMQPRLLIAFGLAITGWSILHMTEFTLGVDFHTVVMARIYQSIGMAFMFVPISTIAYAYIPPGKNNAASALINLARNIGGSFGIAFVATLLARRAQFHQSVLVSHLDAGNPQVQSCAAGDDATFRAAAGQLARRAAPGLWPADGPGAAASDHAGLRRYVPGFGLDVPGDAAVRVPAAAGEGRKGRLDGGALIE